MGPEEDSEFEVSPGKVWLVPLGDDGEPAGDPQEIRKAGVSDFSWGEDPGLDGGLQGGPEGTLGENDLGVSRGSGQVWSLEFTMEDVASSDEVMALIWGMTLAEYRDWRRWLGEMKWLSRVTGLSWGLT